MPYYIHCYMYTVLVLVPLWPPPFLAILRYSVLVLMSIFVFLVFLRGLRVVSTEKMHHFEQLLEKISEKERRCLVSVVLLIC